MFMKHILQFKQRFLERFSGKLFLRLFEYDFVHEEQHVFPYFKA